MKVSICIPAYKHVEFLKRCLDSILEQSCTDFEIIITDDSPDDSIQALVKDIYTDARIRYYKNTIALGSPANWNEGLRYAEGVYVKIMHHDDWFSSAHSLQEYVNLLDDNSAVDIAFSGSCDINGSEICKEHEVNSVVLSKLNRQPERLFLGNVLGAPSVCIFRNRKGYVFDPKLIWLVDTDFYIRTIGNLGLAYTSQKLVNIGVSEFQITNSDLSNNKIRVAEKLYLYRKFKLQSKSSQYRRSLLKAIGREAIFREEQLKMFLSEADFRFSGTDALWTRYYYLKRVIGRKLGL